jgi:hypothetical protein
LRPQPSASNAYTPVCCDPTYTTPCATVGEELPTATRDRHSGSHDPLAQASTSNA